MIDENESINENGDAVEEIAPKIKSYISSFVTTDMPLVSFLKYSGYTIQKVNRVNAYKAEFVFEDVDRELLAEFNAERSLVEPSTFAGIMKHLTQSAKRTIAND